MYLKTLMPDIFQKKMLTFMVQSIEEPGPLIEWMPGYLVNIYTQGPSSISDIHNDAMDMRVQPATPSCDWIPWFGLNTISGPT